MQEPLAEAHGGAQRPFTQLLEQQSLATLQAPALETQMAGTWQLNVPWTSS